MESIDGGDGSDKAKATLDLQKGEKQERRIVSHTYWKKSSVRSLQFSKLCPNLFNAITNELPWTFIRWWDNGLTFSDAMFKGIKRAGPDYLYQWLDENRVVLSENGIMVISALKFYHSFITYDTLLEFLKDNNWAELKIDKAPRTLDGHPSISIEEETVQKQESIQVELSEALAAIAEASKIDKEKFLMVLARYNHGKCGLKIRTGYRDQGGGRAFVFCPRCRIVIQLSKSEVISI